MSIALLQYAEGIRDFGADVADLDLFTAGDLLRLQTETSGLAISVKPGCTLCSFTCTHTAAL